MTTRKRSLFYKKIQCKHCGKNFKSKKQNSHKIYCCSTYDNSGKCFRNEIKEEYLLRILIIKFGSDFSIEEMVNEVEKIEVEDNMNFTIYYKNYPPTKIRETVHEY